MVPGDQGLRERWVKMGLGTITQMGLVAKTKTRLLIP